MEVKILGAEGKIPRSVVIAVFCVCQKTRRAEKRMYRLSFPLPNITTWFPSLHRSVICGKEGEKKKSQQSGGIMGARV